MDLYRRSVEIIRENQAATGAYLAAPSFPDYRYAWFRDGAFIAHAMDLAGEHESARRFHDWGARTLLRHAGKVERLKALAAAGALPATLRDEEVLHPRFTVEGEEVGLPWGNFQLDGYGAWLWSLAAHLARTGDGRLPPSWRPAVELAADYLLLLWRHPCFDCWEEFGDRVHPSTLAAVYGGLAALAPLLAREDLERTLPLIRGRILETRTVDGHFPKFVGTREVDASLIWLATPFDAVPAGDPTMERTMARIREDLGVGEALHRYTRDTYYGGGLWMPTTAFHGWHLARLGAWERAAAVLRWMERRAGPRGDLPEQVPEHLVSPGDHQRWREEKGPPASPLVWSHAMYVILWHALGGGR